MIEAKDESGVMEYEFMDVDLLIPYKYNSKIHSEENIRGLQSSISRIGVSQPITVDKNMVIIGGHGRLEACKRLGMRQVPVRVLDHLDEQGVKEARIAENRTASTEYDTELMKLEFADMDLEKIDAIAIGFDEAEFLRINLKLDEFDSSALTENLDKDVDAQVKEAEHDVTKADLKMISVTNGLGFSKVAASDNRKIAKFIGGLQEQYGTEDPALAFLQFIGDMEAA